MIVRSFNLQDSCSFCLKLLGSLESVCENLPLSPFQDCASDDAVVRECRGLHRGWKNQISSHRKRNILWELLGNLRRLSRLSGDSTGYSSGRVKELFRIYLCRFT